MVAIRIDDNHYLISYSFSHRTPGSILVNELPVVDDVDKLYCYKYIDNKFVFDASKWEKIEEKRAQEEAANAAKAKIEETNEKINVLKGELSSSDYKIIKCMECSLLGLDLPYDPQDLHEERQAMRDEINKLELNLSRD